MIGLSNTANCVQRTGAHLAGRWSWRWYEREKLDWADGYRILLRIETHFWEHSEHVPGVRRILDSCRRLVLEEMKGKVSR